MYKNQFDYLICYNSADERKLKILGVPLFKQDSSCLPINPLGVAWKLYPPRLRLESHEIVIDNDIIILNSLPEIETFLSSNDTTLLYEGLPRRRFTLGRYRRYVDSSINLNSGIYGMPPKFEFEKKILKLIYLENQKEWTKCFDRDTTFDEQGIVATILYNHKSKVVIPQNKIPICESSLKIGEGGVHFSGANWKDGYNFWNQYKIGLDYFL